MLSHCVYVYHIAWFHILAFVNTASVDMSVDTFDKLSSFPLCFDLWLSISDFLFNHLLLEYVSTSCLQYCIYVYKLLSLSLQIKHRAQNQIHSIYCLSNILLCEHFLKNLEGYLRLWDKDKIPNNSSITVCSSLGSIVSIFVSLN